MKKQILTSLVTIILGVSIFSSCIKQDMDSRVANEAGKVAGLNVPAGFDWKNSSNVSCNFTANHDTKIYVSLTESAAPFATFVVGNSEDMEPVTLSLPTSVEAIFVRYDTDGGISPAKRVAVNNASLSYAIPADSDEYKDTTAVSPATRAQSYLEVKYPATGWGTLLFEDLWPSYGDYDFNDFVVNYQITLFPNNKNMVKDIAVTIRVNALGGSLPNDLFLKMVNVHGGQITDVVFDAGSNMQSGQVEMIPLNNESPSIKDPALFRFSNIRSRSKFPEAKYMNTEPGFEVAQADLLVVSFSVELRNSIPIRELTDDSFDFFIGYEKEGSKTEIHGGGYAPILYGEENYLKAQRGSLNTNKAKGYYYSNTNLVWALNVPAEIPHAHESIDFMKVYPIFAQWAESGGAQHKDWYETRTEGTFIGKN